MTSLSAPHRAAVIPPAGLLRPALAFAPFLAVSLAHLVFQLLSLSTAASLSKWLLMPALIVAVVLATPARRSFSTAMLIVAITLSWLGDITLISASDLLFALGLGFFLLSHLAYLTLFARGLGYAKPRPWAAIYVVWWLVFVWLLGPHLGGLLIPVALYGVVLGAMAAFASRGGVTLALGGALFVLSDTLLGSNKFLPDFTLWESGFVIMVTYLGAQGLIAWGVLALQRRGFSSPVAVSSPAEPA